MASTTVSCWTPIVDTAFHCFALCECCQPMFSRQAYMFTFVSCHPTYHAVASRLWVPPFVALHCASAVGQCFSQQAWAFTFTSCHPPCHLSLQNMTQQNLQSRASKGHQHQSQQRQHPLFVLSSATYRRLDVPTIPDIPDANVQNFRIFHAERFRKPM